MGKMGLQKDWCAALCLVLILSLGLSACGEPEPEVGTYLCMELLDGNIPLDTPDSKLLLDQGGYARLEREGEGGAAHWSLDGNVLELYVDGETLDGTLVDGIIRLETAEGLILIYVREDQTERYREEFIRQRETAAAQQELWSGEWYGWWRIENAQGELADGWYDLCARLLAQPDGGMALLLWDEDQSAEEPMAQALLRFDAEGRAVSEDGFFWFIALEEGNLVLTLEDGTITASGHHEGGGESFDYTVCMRQWGTRWDKDAPYYYENWYLPLVEAGETMPERMNPGK